MNPSMTHLFATYQRNIATGDGTRFAARPLKHWRKAYQNSLGYSRAATGMPMDRPGGLVSVATQQIQCATCKGAMPAQVTIFKDSNCKSCQPIKSKVKPLQTAYTNTATYLQSRCATYDQKLNTDRVQSISYFSPEGIPLEPTDSPTGTQVRQTENCFSPQIYNTVCNTTIYKPNNTQFAQQGGVSSSSRISRLKYNTLNQNGAEYNSASGAMGVNSGRYQSEPSPSYYVKNKPQDGVCERKTGKKSYCPVQVLPPVPPAPIKNYYAYAFSQADTTSTLWMYSIDNNTGQLTPLSPPTIPNDYFQSFSINAATINNITSLYVMNYYVNSLTKYNISNNGQLSILSTQYVDEYPALIYGFDIASINNKNYAYFAIYNFESIKMNEIDNSGQVVLQPSIYTFSDTPISIKIISLNNHSYAYVTSNNNLVSMYEISENGQLAPLSPPTIGVPNNIYLSNLATITLDNNISYAYIAYYTNSLSTFSINSNTGQLSLLSTEVLSGLDNARSMTTVIINNNAYAYVTNIGNGGFISVYSISNTGQLSLLSQSSSILTPTSITIVAV